MPTQTSLFISFILAVFGVTLFCGVILIQSSYAGLGDAVPWLGGFAALLASGAIYTTAHILYRHFKALRRLRDGVVMLLAESTTKLPPDDDFPREITRLRDAIGTLVARRFEQGKAPDRRLTAVLSSIAEAIVVTTTSGQVSLVNNAARTLLGAKRVAVGTSLYAAMSRGDVETAVASSRDKGRPVEARLRTVDGEILVAKVADLGTFGGTVISFPIASLESHAALEHDLALHDTPPTPTPITKNTLLTDLPALVFDCETTGLDVKRDVIVALGGVRMHGTQLYRSETIDRLVDPGRPIPPQSTRIHGITDRMVSDAGAFDTHWPSLHAIMQGTVLVGHNIAFDIAHLRAAASQFGINWTPPPTLDTLLLTAALEPSAPGYDLEAIAARFGVSVHGRHTALGDSLVTAEIYARLVPLLVERNVRTLGEAISFGLRAKAFVKRQKESGWFESPVD